MLENCTIVSLVVELTRRLRRRDDFQYIGSPDEIGELVDLLLEVLDNEPCEET